MTFLVTRQGCIATSWLDCFAAATFSVTGYAGILDLIIRYRKVFVVCLLLLAVVSSLIAFEVIEVGVMPTKAFNLLLLSAGVLSMFYYFVPIEPSQESRYMGESEGSKLMINIITSIYWFVTLTMALLLYL